MTRTHERTPNRPNGVPARSALVAGVFGLGMLVGVCNAGPVDRTEVSRFLSSSALDLPDLNGDCLVSDVDAALFYRDRFKAIFGDPMDLPDHDGDGFVSGNDFLALLADQLRLAFGKAADDDEPVDEDDIALITSRVLAGDPLYDIDGDGETTPADINAAAVHLGAVVHLHHTAEPLANSLYQYISAIELHGEAAFIATACMDDAPGHIVTISDSYQPDFPRWWPANHLTASSDLWPGDHDVRASTAWPGNHWHEVSDTWPPPPVGQRTRGLFAPEQAVAPGHAGEISSTWPTGHAYEMSRSWGEPMDHALAASALWREREDGDRYRHDRMISKCWWPNHVLADSVGLIWPSMHEPSITESWGHDVELSVRAHPPNHQGRVSEAWGAHMTGGSAFWPPSHVPQASTTWPRPRPDWPANHDGVVSNEHDQPARATEDPADGAIFPAGHSWWTTGLDIVLLLLRRFSRW